MNGNDESGWEIEALRERIARLGAAAPRIGESPDLESVLGGLAIHYDEHRVSVAGRPVELTATEYELLRLLSLNAGRVSAYEPLLRRVSGKAGRPRRQERPAHPGQESPPKLGDDAAEPAWILSAHGVGYRMPRPAER